jgi:hypothetical protein
VSPGKRELARCFAALGLSRAGLAAQRALLWPFVRAINYTTYLRREDAFDRQLDFYAEHFECVDERGLLAFHRGEWKSDRPGLLLSFDDGLRSHAEVVAPRLEARGWSDGSWCRSGSSTRTRRPGRVRRENTGSDTRRSTTGIRALPATWDQCAGSPSATSSWFATDSCTGASPRPVVRRAPTRDSACEGATRGGARTRRRGVRLDRWGRGVLQPRCGDGDRGCGLPHRIHDQQPSDPPGLRPAPAQRTNIESPTRPRSSPSSSAERWTCSTGASAGA